MPAAKGSALSRALRFFREGDKDEVRVAFALVQEIMISRRKTEGPKPSHHKIVAKAPVAKKAKAKTGSKSETQVQGARPAPAAQAIPPTPQSHNQVQATQAPEAAA